MINNRQGGRRRGRGGQRGPNPGGQPGNRQDNRQRGNAAQLLEKYKSMARDSQLAGDRVQAEYYLQFADHYFRVVDEGRSRFDDQKRQRGDDMDDDDGDDSEGESNDGDFDSNDDRPARAERDDRPQRSDRSPRRERSPSSDRAVGNAGGNDGDNRPAPRARNHTDSELKSDDSGSDSKQPERSAPRPRRETKRSDQANGGDTLSFDALPPAIGVEPPVEESKAVDDGPKPRRRARAARPAEGDDDIVPAT